VIGKVPIVEVDSEIHLASMALDSKNNRVLVTVSCTADVCDSSHDALWVIDANTNRVIKRIRVPGIWDVAVNAATGRTYLTISPDEVWVLDSMSYRVTGKFNVPDVSSVVADPNINRLYIESGSDPRELFVVDGATNRITNRLKGIGMPVALDTRRKLVHGLTGQSVVSVDTDTYEPARTTSLGWSADALDLDPVTGDVYVLGGSIDKTDPQTEIFDVEYVNEMKIFTSRGREKATVQLELDAIDIEVDESTEQLYVLGRDLKGSATLVTLDSRNGSVLARLPDVSTISLLRDAAHRRLYVLGFEGVTILDLAIH
jgi:DNA-binding beta-propeller fold protein YncE